MNTTLTFAADSFTQGFSSSIQQQALSTLEDGFVLFFPKLSFILSEDEQCLLSPRLANTKAKNISFEPNTGLLRGTNCPDWKAKRLKEMMARYAFYTQQFLIALLPLYALTIKQARTSFRPVEILGRVSTYRKDDTRLHVDAFPSAPNRGWRILRIFTNINPYGQERVWRIGAPFEEVAHQFLPQIRTPLPGSAAIMQLLRITKGRRSLYDHFMLKIHNLMKADQTYQKQVRQCELRFPPGSSWMVQTDQVSHAAMSGQYVLEQTFQLPVHGMMNPKLSPLLILQRLTGRQLI